MAHLSKMQDIGAWKSSGRLQEFLAQQLSAGRLALVLGAGVLHGFGLPDWDQLTERAFAAKGVSRPSGVDNETAADTLLARHCNNDDMDFARTISEALYGGVDLSMNGLRRRDILAAIGSLMMASTRGSVSRVITFNFDDLLERYLAYHGHYVESISVVPAWDSRVDSRVYHVHGLLPSDSKADIPGPIVMAQLHYDRIVGKNDVAWRMTMLDVMRANTCVFIGLSGRDKNLLSVLSDVKPVHSSVKTHDAFWGVRLAKSGDALKDAWELRGVYQLEFSDYGEYPDWLFALCQAASEMWRGKFTL